MFINKANIKLYVAALFSALIASSCLNLDETQDGTYGYLTISGIDVDINVSELVPTKSGSTVDIKGVRNYSAPQLGSASVTVTDSKGDEHAWTGEQLILPLGAYTVSATYGSNSFDAPYFVGTASGTISDNLNSATVKFTLANSVMKVTTDMKEHIDDTKPVIISYGVSESVNADFGEYVFVPSGKSLKISGTNKAGASFSTTLDEQIEPGKAYFVTLSKEGATLPTLTLPAQQDGAWGGRLYVNPIASVSGMSEESLRKIVYKVYSDNLCTQLVAASEEGALVVDGLTNGATYYVQAQVGAIKSDVKTINVVAPTVDVSHFNDSNGDLAGSKAVLDLKLNDFLKERVDVSEAILANGTNQMRNATASGEMSVINNWPYIPQGTDYKLTVSHKLKSESESESESSMTPIEVPAPVFGVTFKNAYTSYDKYKGTNNISQSTSEANTCDPDMLKGSGVSCTISSQLMGNQKYSKSFKVHKRDETPIGNIKTEFSSNDFTHDIDGLNWTSYEVASSFTFDGVTKTSGYKTHHITGLPYKSPDFLSNSITLKSTSNASDTDWVSIGNVEYWKDHGYQLMYYYLGDPEVGSIFSPKFKVPQSTDVKYESSACFFTTGRFDADVTIYSGVATSFTKSTSYSKEINRNKSNSNPDASKFSSFSHDTVLDSAARISIGTDESKDGNAAENWVTIRYLNVSYR